MAVPSRSSKDVASTRSLAAGGEGSTRDLDGAAPELKRSEGVVDKAKKMGLFVPWAALTGLVVADKSWSIFKILKYTIMTLIPGAAMGLWASKWTILSTIANAIFGALRHILAPLVVVLGGLWINRDWLIGKAVEFTKKKGVALKPLTIDADTDFANKAASVQIRGIGIGVEKGAESKSTEPVENIAEIDDIYAGYSLADGADIVIDGVRIAFVTHDMKFKDTNINRMLERLGVTDDDAEGKAPAPAPAPAKKDDGPAAPPPKFKARIRSGEIKVMAKGPLGTRSIIPPIKLDDEQLSHETLSSKIALLKWVNGVVLRTVASSGFDLVSGAFDGVTGGALAVTDKAFGAIDNVADKVPGGFLVKGATGATSSILKGTVGGASKVVGGVAGGGKAVAKGVTSGSVSGFTNGLKDAGGQVGGGLKAGVKSAGSGVKGATTAEGRAKAKA